MDYFDTPDTFNVDIYGQNLAEYEEIVLKPGETVRTGYRGEVTITAVQYQIPVTAIGELTAIPRTVRDAALAPDPYFAMDNPEIQAAAQASRRYLTGKEPETVNDLVRNIVFYVIDIMKYTMDDGWVTADTVLNQRSGSCSEYSFLFSALCRLNGIPTRLIGGFEITKDGAGAFHRWTEIWFPGIGWVPADVTKIDSSDTNSYDFEYLYGLPGRTITLSIQYGINKEGLGLNYYIYRKYSGGKIERRTWIESEGRGAAGLSEVRIEVR